MNERADEAHHPVFLERWGGFCVASPAVVDRLLSLGRIDRPQPGMPPVVRVACERSILDQAGRTLRVFDLVSRVQHDSAARTYRTRLYIDGRGSIVRHELADGTTTDRGA